MYTHVMSLEKPQKSSAGEWLYAVYDIVLALAICERRPLLITDATFDTLAALNVDQ